jgi:hypothetical protein
MQALYVECPNCEGTGHLLNRFDPPKAERIRDLASRPFDSDYRARSRSGWLVEEDLCSRCHGDGKIRLPY